MRRPELTVLTTPIQGAPRRAYQRMRSALRPLVKPGVPLPETSEYPGHRAVTRSVVEGLRAIDADFNFNPRTFAELAAVVYAPANEALAQAIDLKRRGAIDYLVAGPVNALLPEECDGILLHPEIDLLIIASEWAGELFAGYPQLRGKTRVCPCGVDAAYWSRRRAPGAVAAVYRKSGSDEFCAAVEVIVRRHGLEPVRLSSAHGDHNRFAPDHFRELLDRSVLAVFLSSFETQGIALAEAWAMDVPTLAWDPRADARWRDFQFRSGSSCPYLTTRTGIAWQTLAELDTAMARALATRATFRPRDWVLANMTDAICARTLCETIMTGARAAVPTA